MKEIQLKKGVVIKIDDEDYERVSQYTWYASFKKGNWSIFACRKEIPVFLSLHRFIMNAQKGDIIDHINRDVLDNRKENLRFTDKSGNGINRGTQKNNTSGYKGVSWEKGRWVASIGFKGDFIRIGYFQDKVEAARAYDKRAKELFGDFAFLNFPEK